MTIRIVGVSGSLTTPSRTSALVDAVVARLGERLEQADDFRQHDESDAARYDAALANAFEAQQVVLPLVLDAATQLFEVGGASAVGEKLALDRHWRNARTIATHNPAIYRARILGDYYLNDTPPTAQLKHAQREPELADAGVPVVER